MSDQARQNLLAIAGDRRTLCRTSLIRLALLVGASALSGCAFHGFSLPKGVYLPNCSYGVLEQSQPARCMTRAEYKTAKEKARQSRDEKAKESSKQPDPRYKDWIP